MIQVFKYEMLDGLADSIQKSDSIAYTLDIKQKDLNEIGLDKILHKSVAGANPNQVDLFYFESILASVGWNKNDDVFDPVELWKARNTAIDKPVNFMHNEADIIGHMTSSKAIDLNGLIPDDTDINNLPSSFDIAVGAVLYKAWENADRQQFMQKLLSEIVDDKWCVSMECIFPHFDYAVITPDGQQKVIARNDSSSFLTKYLRIFGGKGEYQNHKLGRFLRGFTFSGKGIVDNPANPKSKITAVDGKQEITAFAGTAASIDIINPKENRIMSAELKYTEEQFKAIADELKSYKAVAEENARKEKEGLAATINELTKKVEASKAIAVELEAQKEITKQKETAIASLTEEVKSVKEQLASAKAEIEQSKIEATKAERLSRLIEKGVAKEKAVSMAEKFAALSEEMFTELLNAFPATEAAKKDEEADKAKCGKMEDDEEEMKSKCSKAEEDLKAAASTNTDPNLAATGDKADSIRAKASAWLTSSLFATKQEDKNKK